MADGTSKKAGGALNDNHTPHIGPYGSREACQKACDAANESDG